MTHSTEPRTGRRDDIKHMILQMHERRRREAVKMLDSIVAEAHQYRVWAASNQQYVVTPSDE